MKNNQIEHFIAKLQSRLNFSKALSIGSWVLAGVGLLLIVHATYYRYHGEAVPWPATIGLLVIAAAALLIGWLMNLTKPMEAARVADQELGLKDSLSSSLSFKGQDNDGEVYQLQLKTAQKLVQDREAKEIPLKYSRRWMVAGFLMTVLAIGLGFLSPSAAVQERMEREALTESRTEEIKKQMEEVVEELTRNLSEEEKEVLNPAELKQWVKDLKATKDQKEALKQLARFEQKVAKAMASMESRKDEASLKLAALELSKSDQSAARQLGKMLEDKKFKEAAEKLKNAGKKAKNEELKAEKKNKFSKEELKKLREMTKRMADAARKRNQDLKNPNGKMAKGDPKGQPQLNGKNMDQMMQDLDDAVAEAEQFDDDMLEEMDQEELDQMEMMEGEFDEKMERMRGRLRKLDAKNKMKKKLAGLRAQLGDAQKFAMGKSSQRGFSNQPEQGRGGQGAGVGTDQNRRNQRDKLENNGQVAELKGQKGAGPSLTAVEDADSGTGVSRRTGEAKAREYQRQLESFVRRDDVPEDVKSGVKEYFEKIHQVQEPQE